jgi:hypothetical protein
VIQIGSDDTTGLDESALRWRWTDERHANLSDEERARIRPLRPEAASKVWRLSTASLGKELELDPSVYEDVERWPARTKNDSGFLARLPAGRILVVVSWDRHTAVLTDSELFVQRWDDFCYPSSDDVTVIRLDESWLLHYWHWEAFLFARKRNSLRDP